jgi:hypothetical protein
VDATPEAIREHLARLTPAAIPFVLRRNADVTGISGTGVVADGVRFPDGRVATRWRDSQGVAQTCAWDRLGHVKQIHGHNGATVVELMPTGALIDAVSSVLRELDETYEGASVEKLAADIYRAIAVALDPMTPSPADDFAPTA